MPKYAGCFGAKFYEYQQPRLERNTLVGAEIFKDNAEKNGYWRFTVRL